MYDFTVERCQHVEARNEPMRPIENDESLVEAATPGLISVLSAPSTVVFSLLVLLTAFINVQLLAESEANITHELFSLTADRWLFTNSVTEKTGEGCWETTVPQQSPGAMSC